MPCRTQEIWFVPQESSAFFLGANNSERRHDLVVPQCLRGRLAVIAASEESLIDR